MTMHCDLPEERKRFIQRRDSPQARDEGLHEKVEVTDAMIDAGVDRLAQIEGAGSVHLVEEILRAALGSQGYLDSGNGCAGAQSND